MTQVRVLGLVALGALLSGLTACGGGDSADTALQAGEVPAGNSLGAAPSGPASGGDVLVDAPARGTATGESASADGLAVGPALAPADPDAPRADPAPRPEPDPVTPGTLTAGAWDDNRNITRFLDYRKRLHDQQMSGLLDFAPAEHTAAQVRTQPAAHSTLDISLVIDTTGSMGDELSYLQSEFTAISSAIEAKYPAAEQRWSLVVYRDRGDDYTTRPFDFESDPQQFRQRLLQQTPGGGGDFPEAPDAAFADMNQFSWRADPATARLAFWVADAPHHDDKAGALKSAIETAQAQGVHIYPVASSGVDELTELTMRSAAQLTGGRYLFLTDDSGVGGAHKEPSIPCYFVTKLDDAILRMVDIEMSGVYREPSAAEVIRTGGDPQNGACELESGQTVYVF
ncbi:MAG TPA: VWA domain-containing protein [Polyangiaceae bacterium]|jgi:hypothetical protein|nr:VWA domain-containing protein [Polyangiaceae bacterium]